ncbi:cyclin-like protein [Sparassis latifolia]|uniref:RNA polymerase II holoenzyme cyclin-like subunit n=1 Tax=Sparassis crispa TaxID=139825 RepID=A0A401GA77_9APHY|nr:RNA polymerase II holoenzyme cyclin-like subunit [Sparassis crispa]GBE79033.1 RNA polymerase II holoenzyme cyclin-like subunit [Sparassis crispa]
MATNFWASSHYKRWILDRATLTQARADDLQYVDSPDHLEFLAIFFANLISKLGKKLQLRQRVIATATVFFRRFYVKNSYCETDPFIVVAACCYVASKAEESPVHIKNVVSEARMLFGSEEYGVKSFPSDNSKLAEMEFYLVDDLECDLTVFHPYRTLMTMCVKEGASTALETEAGELGAGAVDGSRYWGTGEGRLELQEGALQMAWFIINDTYRSDLCLLYPPHLIAITAIYLSLVLHSSTRTTIQLQVQSHTQPAQFSHSASQPLLSTSSVPRRSARSTSSSHKKQPQDIVGFMAGLHVSMPLIATIAQEMVSLYTLWDRYKEDPNAESARGAFATTGRKRDVSGALRGGTADGKQDTVQSFVTPMFLIRSLIRMREARLADMAHPASGRPVAVNKMLERAQAAG